MKKAASSLFVWLRASTQNFGHGGESPESPRTYTHQQKSVLKTDELGTDVKRQLLNNIPAELKLFSKAVLQLLRLSITGLV